MGIYRRGTILWLRWKGADGKWHDRSSGYAIGEESKAREMYTELVRQSAPPPAEPAAAPGGALTVRAWVAEWLPKRGEQGLDWKGDDSRLRLHVLPFLGDLMLRDVRTRSILDMMHALRTDRERDLSPRSIWHVYSITKALFRDAQLAELIEHSPCVLDERQLGPVVDRDPEWRSGATFTHDEVETIITDDQIPADRHMVYGLELLAGVRPGEAAALRWRHYTATKQPLGELLVAKAFNTKRNLEKSTKTGSVKHVPVHPTLAAMLAEWKLGGWQAMMGRAPGPDDLIVPLPPDAAERRRTRGGEPYRPNDYSCKRWLEDVAALGWRHRRHYDMRATFITLSIEDGADPEILENRVTHTRQRRSAFDGYDRGEHWARTCAEVAKLRITRRGREVATVAAAATPDESAAVPLQSIASTRKSSYLVLPATAAGAAAGAGCRCRGFAQ